MVISLIDGLKNHNPLKGFGTSIITLAKDHKCQQFGKSDEDEALVRQWIEYTACYVNYSDVRTTAIQVLKELNTVLATRSYFVGNTQTLADIVIYYSLYNVMESLSYQEKEQHLHVSRWFNNIQQDNKLRQNRKIISFSRIPIYL
uniref:GST C-terminal domain-containing protein n=1 Tax=Timema bartmani TaxID=61472 RepID=A0A7R9F8X3_9NEOP|nr:unnamed protein product [Timema bartmani]